MHLSFLIPLATAAISGYIYSKSADEMAYLSAAVFGVSLLVALIVSPILLKLSGVLLLWATNRKLDLNFDL